MPKEVNMVQGKYRKLSEVLQDLENEGVDPEDVLINQDDILEANPIFKENPEDE